MATRNTLIDNDIFEQITTKVKIVNDSLAVKLSYCFGATESEVEGRNKLEILRSIDTNTLLDVNAPTFDFFTKVLRFSHNVFEVARNVLVLAPVGLTWYALSEAVKTYSRVAENYPSIPFLVLWENGFYNPIFDNWLKFGSVAVYDAWLIILIVILTLLSFLTEAFVNKRFRWLLYGLKAQVDQIIWNKELELLQQVNRIKLQGEDIVSIVEQFERLVSEIYDGNKNIQVQFAQLSSHIMESENSNLMRWNAEYGRAEKISNMQLDISEKIDGFASTLGESAFQVVDLLEKTKVKLLGDSDRLNIEKLVSEIAQQKNYWREIALSFSAAKELEEQLFANQAKLLKELHISLEEQTASLVSEILSQKDNWMKVSSSVDLPNQHQTISVEHLDKLLRRQEEFFSRLELGQNPNRNKIQQVFGNIALTVIMLVLTGYVVFEIFVYIMRF